jgi:hypothetical protein
MKQAVFGAFALAAALGGGVPSAAAQVRGIPVYNAGIPRGIGIYGDAGFPNNEAGGGNAYGVTGRLGMGAFGATAMLSSYDPDGSNGSDVSVGATLNYRVFGGPLVPLAVTLQAGIGYAQPDQLLPNDEIAEESELRFPVGVGFALTIPNPALAIKPWLAPRLDIVKRSDDSIDPDFTDDTETEFGLSGGLEFNLLNGLGLHASYDAIFVDGENPGVFGVGAHYTFSVPGL